MITQGTATSKAGHKPLPCLLCEECTHALSGQTLFPLSSSHPVSSDRLWLLGLLLPATLPAVHVRPDTPSFAAMTSSTHSHYCITEVLQASKVSPSTVHWSFWWIGKAFQFFSDIKIEWQLNPAKQIWNSTWFCRAELMSGYSSQILLLRLCDPVQYFKAMML